MKDDLANEDLAHLRALTEPKDDMLKRETPLPKASPVCPVCGIAVPHAHDYAGLMTLIVKQKNDLAAAQAERDKWKAMAEWQYGVRVYPHDMTLSKGALDIYIEKWSPDATIDAARKEGA